MLEFMGMVASFMGCWLTVNNRVLTDHPEHEVSAWRNRDYGGIALSINATEMVERSVNGCTPRPV